MRLRCTGWVTSAALEGFLEIEIKFELQRELFRRYPRLFRRPGHNTGRGAEQRLPFDERGVECGDGWFLIIDRLSQACEREVERLAAEGAPREDWPRVAQIKEKFGSLRFRVWGQLSDALRALILGVEETESRYTCERCGLARTPRSGDDLSTYCGACQAECETGGLQEEFSEVAKDRQAALRALLDSRPQ